MKTTTFNMQGTGSGDGNDSIKSNTAGPRMNMVTLSSLIATNRAMLRPIYLTFKQPDLESEYGRYFVKYNLRRWRRSKNILFGILSLLYLYFFIQNSFDSAYWVSHFSPELKGTVTSYNIMSFCPAGWYCAPSNPDMIPMVYTLTYDIGFWSVSILMPFILGTIASQYLVSTFFTEYNDHISSIFITIITFVGVGIRYYIIEGATSFVQPTLIINMILLLGVYNLRIRFIYAVVTIWWIIILWITINIPPLILQHDSLHATGRSYGIAMASLVLTGIIISIMSYETEYFHRMQFLMSKEMKKNNAKLTNQLKLLAKSYNKKAGSLDSPLERSVMVIRSVMADPILSSQHLMALGQVLALLSSSNLLTPDLEGTIGDSLDNEQEAWLFSEIAARRRRGRAKSGGRRRPSFSHGIAGRIEPPIIEAQSLYQEEFRDDPEMTPHYRQRDTMLMTEDDLGAEYPPVIEGIAPLLARCVEYNWPIFEVTQATYQHPLSVLAQHLFTTGNLFEAFSVPRDKFRSFIRTIEKGYHDDLPYHNSIHAADVLHCMSFLANDEKIKQVTSEVEVFSMYLAAIIHDHDHPGLTNNFLNNFLSHLSKTDFKAIREIVVDLVLATDLTQHFTLLSMFKAKVASLRNVDPYETREDRMLLYKIMINVQMCLTRPKTCICTNPGARLISEEFYLQGDMEKKLSLPVSPYMDRENVNIPSSQVGFIDYVVMPLFDALDKFQPIPSILNRLQRNREYWAHLKLQGITHHQLGGPNLPSSSSGGSSTQQRMSTLPRASNSHSQILTGSKMMLSIPQPAVSCMSVSEEMAATSQIYPTKRKLTRNFINEMIRY
ncbi:hypothetical protein BASA83_012408 [Batrachochytrium salamandrivorans]|nr:hypothetical protein BASA83_012408 [Batrachochytrium salamandrivorans]